MKWYIYVCALLAVASVAQAQTPQQGQPPRLGTESGFGIFQQKCMICHGKADAPEKAPDPQVLRQLAPERILDALTNGVMKIQGQALSDEEKRRVAESVSGRLLGSAAAGDPKAMAATLRREIESLGGNLVKDVQVKTMTEHLDPQLGPMRSGAKALGVFGLLALVLAVVGIYGVMAYAVARRTREIGIRMALGADTTAVLRLVLGNGMTLALIGVAIGLAVAFAVTRLLSSFLYGVSATDPGAFISASLLWVLVALLASYIPARRATRLDPLAALRHE